MRKKMQGFPLPLRERDRVRGRLEKTQRALGQNHDLRKRARAPAKLRAHVSRPHRVRHRHGRQARYEGQIDMPMCDGTVELDGEIVLKRGRFKDPKLIVEAARA